MIAFEMSLWGFRLLTALAATISLVSAYRNARRVGSIFRPHFYFIAAWSFVLAVAMGAYAFEVELPGVGVYFRQGINVAAANALAGWATLGWRLRHRMVLP